MVTCLSVSKRCALLVRWGFGQDLHGTTCVFVGPRGTGKSLACEAVAYELARPLRSLSALEVLTTYRTGTRNAAPGRRCGAPRAVTPGRSTYRASGKI